MLVCGNYCDGDLLDLMANGWERVQGGAEGPVFDDDEILALWQEHDIAGDLIELVGLLFGVRAREVVSRIALRGHLAAASVHVRGRRLRHADVWLTVTDEEEVFQGIFVRRDAFVSPEVREMIEVAAVGDES